MSSLDNNIAKQDEIIDQSLFAFTRGNVPYGIGQDLNRPNIEEFVNTTQRAGAFRRVSG